MDITGQPSMSRTFLLKREQWVPSSLEETFSFFSDAGNLETITPPWLHFRILTPQPIRIAAGTEIEYRLRWRGIPLRWRTEIARWEPPFTFEDRQASGPYRLWHHVHTFEPERGGTRMTDIVRYALPFGPLGGLVHALSVRRNVEQIFDFRFRRIEELPAFRR